METISLYIKQPDFLLTNLVIRQNYNTQEKSLLLEFSDELDRKDRINLFHPHDLESIGEIYSADRIWIEKVTDSQMEFGTIYLGLSGEVHTEIYFDSIEITLHNSPTQGIHR